MAFSYTQSVHRPVQTFGPFSLSVVVCRGSEPIWGEGLVVTVPFGRTLRHRRRQGSRTPGTCDPDTLIDEGETRVQGARRGL